MGEISIFAVCVILATTWAAWLSWLVIYRLFFHPLTGTPGPKLAIVTFWYETYYETFKGGRYTWKIGELHKQYGRRTLAPPALIAGKAIADRRQGPIIRINPDEIHINDPEYYDTIYSGPKQRVEKPAKAADIFGPVPATFGAVEHELHRLRRVPLNKHFSKKSVSDLQPWIVSSIEKLCGRLKEALEKQEIVNLKYAYSAVARDIIDQYCFSRTMDSVLIPDFNKDYNDALEAGHHVTPVFSQFRWLGYLLHSLPGWLTKLLNPGFGKLLDEMEKVSEQVEAMRAGKYEAHKYSQHPTVLHDLLESDLPPAEKSKTRIRAEAQTLIGGGTSTVSIVLTITTCHLVANPEARLKLFQELQTAMPAPDTVLPLYKLEQLPYLTAVILEGQRLSHPAPLRLLRSFPDTTLVYGGRQIPPGTPVSMSSPLIHENPDIFPDPLTYKPERWLGNDGQRLKRYLVLYSKGTRACLGMNLANAELYITFAMIFRRFNFELIDVVRERDYTVSRNTQIGSMSPESKGVTVGVKAATNFL